jgi:hypothetical protein
MMALGYFSVGVQLRVCNAERVPQRCSAQVFYCAAGAMRKIKVFSTQLLEMT